MKTKEAYLQQADARLKALEADIERLRFEIKHDQVEADIDYEDFMKVVHEQWQTVTARVHKLERSSGEAWTALSDGVEHAFEELQNAVGEAKSKFDLPDTTRRQNGPIRSVVAAFSSSWARRWPWPG